MLLLVFIDATLTCSPGTAIFCSSKCSVNKNLAFSILLVSIFYREIKQMLVLICSLPSTLSEKRRHIIHRTINFLVFDEMMLDQPQIDRKDHDVYFL